PMAARPPREPESAAGADPAETSFVWATESVAHARSAASAASAAAGREDFMAECRPLLRGGAIIIRAGARSTAVATNSPLPKPDRGNPVRAASDRKALLGERQAAHSLPRRGEDGVGDGRRHWRQCRLADSGGRVRALNEMHVHPGRVRNAQNGI